MPPPIAAQGAAAPLGRPLVTADRVPRRGRAGRPAGLARRRRPTLVAQARPSSSCRRPGGAVEPLTLIALGPLTNVALALERDAAALRRLARVVVMGGAVDVRGQRDADGGVQHPRRSRGRRPRARRRAARSISSRSTPPARPSLARADSRARAARAARARWPRASPPSRGAASRGRRRGGARAWCCTIRSPWRPRSIRPSSAGRPSRLRGRARRRRRGARPARQLPLRAAASTSPRFLRRRSWSACAPRPRRRLRQRRLHGRAAAAARGRARRSARARCSSRAAARAPTRRWRRGGWAPRCG